MDIASQKIIIKNTKHFFKYQYDYYSSLANEANTIKGMKFSSTTVDSSRDCKIVCVRMNDSLNLFL